MVNSLLLRFPPEITEHALLLANPRDVASFAQTCRYARSLVYRSNDQHLWRQMFLLHPFDDPRATSLSPSGSLPDTHVNWMKELQRRFRASRTISNLSSRPDGLLDALKTLLSIVHSALQVSSDSPSRVQSHDLVWLGHTFHAAKLYRVDTQGWSSEEQQCLAQLFCYVGWRDGIKSGAPRSKSRNEARGFVYDLRNYTRLNDYGPFLPDNTGGVSWKHVEYIITVIDRNLADLGSMWEHTRPPRSLEALRAYSAPGVLKRDSKDWAGVEGIWRRYVSFMDYRDLFAFNFSSESNGAYDLGFFDDDEFQEATRLIELKLRITGTKPCETHPDRPKLIIEGHSRSNGNVSRVRGSVGMTQDGYIRWKLLSIQDGVPQWSSEGVQIGNVACAAGIVGIWTGAQHEAGDPAGPFWLWKVAEDHPTSLNEVYFF